MLEQRGVIRTTYEDAASSSPRLLLSSMLVGRRTRTRLGSQVVFWLMAFLPRPGWTATRAAAAFCLAAIVAGCVKEPGLVLTRQAEARRLVSDLRVQFIKAADAANRAVMADTDEASSVAAQEAGQATQTVQRDTEALKPILNALAYPEEIRHLDAFNARFGEYLALDAEILPLAVENTNLKAQRLSFGPAREAADSFAASLEAAARSAITAKNTCCVEALVARARAAVLEIQVVQARHIAESDEAAMSHMEAEMTASDSAARNALERLKRSLRLEAGPQLDTAAAALDRFKTINAELITLSRRNSNVRSLALSLGRKRTVTAECDDLLRALEDALAKHEFRATR